MHYSPTAPSRAKIDAWRSSTSGIFDRRDPDTVVGISPALEADLADLVEKAVAAIRSGEAKADVVFGDFAGLVSLARSAAYHEGKLLEWGLVRLAAENPDLTVLPRERPMPVVPAALEILERNGWNSLEGIRLRSEVHAKASYTPDLVIVDRRKHSALILDMKRALSSYSEHRLEALRRRMMAVALIASDWLHVEGKVPPVSQVGIAIVDGSGQASDHDRGVFSIGEIGSLIGVEHAGIAMERLRALFSARIRQEMASACRGALAVIGEECRRNRGDPRRAVDDAGRSDPFDGGVHDRRRNGDDWPPRDEGYDSRPGVHDRRACGQALQSGRSTPRIAVGFARAGGDP